MHSTILAFLNIGTQEMILIVFIALLMFGGKKLPELARGLGKGIREFKDASEGIKREIADQINNFEKDLDAEEKPKALEETNVSEPTPEVAETSSTSEENALRKQYEFTAPEGAVAYDPHRQLNYGEQPSYAANEPLLEEKGTTDDSLQNASPENNTPKEA